MDWEGKYTKYRTKYFRLRRQIGRKYVDCDNIKKLTKKEMNDKQQRVYDYLLVGRPKPPTLNATRSEKNVFDKENFTILKSKHSSLFLQGTPLIFRLFSPLVNRLFNITDEIPIVYCFSPDVRYLYLHTPAVLVSLPEDTNLISISKSFIYLLIFLLKYTLSMILNVFLICFDLRIVKFSLSKTFFSERVAFKVGGFGLPTNR